MDNSKNLVASKPSAPGIGKNIAVPDPLVVMLEAHSVALVGASPRPGSLGARMIEEVGRSPARPRTYLVNPRHRAIGEAPCYRSLADLPEPVDLALLAVPDAALEEQVRLAARIGTRSAVIFGSAVDPAAGGLAMGAPAAGNPAAGASASAGAGAGAGAGAAGDQAAGAGRAGPGLRDRIGGLARE
ncbi:MAG TPA: CoA-binding protein, partial [Trebonia sp.]